MLHKVVSSSKISKRLHRSVKGLNCVAVSTKCTFKCTNLISDLDFSSTLTVGVHDYYKVLLDRKMLLDTFLGHSCVQECILVTVLCPNNDSLLLVVLSYNPK